MPLSCETQHKMCADCLPNNIAKFGSKREYMYTCPECTKPATEEFIWIFVDNSNIWIQAKKLASKIKGFKSDEDHRLRISIGGLTDVLANERQVKEATLYGSEPPKIDSVWEKIEQHENWHVKTKKKSYITHKEKEIDSQLVADVTQVAGKVPPFQRGTIVLISGDADMYPAVEKIMEEGDWKVEIYMWEKALSARLKELTETYPERVICEPLDNKLDKVTFTNKKLPADKLEGIENVSAVMLMEDDCFPQHVIEDWWWNQLESIAQWPVQYWWIIRDGEADELLLVFDSKRETETYNVSNFVGILGEDIANAKEGKPLLPYVIRAETYVDYKKRMKRFEAIMKSGRYYVFDIERDSNFVAKNSAGSLDMKFVESPTFGQDTSTPQHGYFKSIPPSQVGGKVRDCNFGKNCLRGTKCKYRHSQSDIIFFEKNGGRGSPTRKAQMCRNYPKCPYTKGLCHFAHGDSDAWCLTCRKQGHFSNNCPRPQ